MPDTPVGTDDPDYLLTSADLGADIYCKVTATNASGSANANSNTVGPVAAAAGSYVGPADVVSGLQHYWGLRGASAAYAAPGTNPGIDVVKASDGTAEQTINILANGSLDVATIAALGYPVKVSKIWDQMRNMADPGYKDFSQATLANMPTLVLSAFGSRPAISFDGTSSEMGSYFSPDGAEENPMAQPFTASAFVKLFNTNAAVQMLVYSAAAGVILDQSTAVGGPFASEMNAGTVLARSLAINSTHGLHLVFNGASSDFNVNGAAQVGAAGAGILGPTVHLGHSASTNRGTFYLTEIGAWNIAFSSGQSSSLYANQTAWWA